jgi:hypothetical protein
MYRKLVPLICAMLLSTAAFGQGGGGGGAGGAGGAAGGGAAGSAGAAGGGTGATGGSGTGSGVNPSAPGSQYTNPATGLPSATARFPLKVRQRRRLYPGPQVSSGRLGE